MAGIMTPLLQLIFRARDGETIYKILKAEGLLSESGLNSFEQIAESINQIKKDGVKNSIPEDYYIQAILSKYLTEKGNQLTEWGFTAEQMEEARRKSLFYASYPTGTCQHCQTEVSSEMQYCSYCGQLLELIPETKATLFIKYSNPEKDWAELEFLIADQTLNIKPNENYPLLMLPAGLYSYQFTYMLSDFRGIQGGDKYEFVGNESYDLVFSLDKSVPSLKIIQRAVLDDT